MSENLKAILKAIMDDDELKKAYEVDVLEVSGKAFDEALLAFANDHGYELTVADIEAAKASAEGELIDEELLAVSGGAVSSDVWGQLQRNCSNTARDLIAKFGVPL